MYKNFPINLKRKLLKEGEVKIKTVDVMTNKEQPTRKHLSKKKVHLFVFDDTVLITLPIQQKKHKGCSTGEVYPFLAASPVIHAMELDPPKEEGFKFEMDLETFMIHIPTPEKVPNPKEVKAAEIKDWVKQLQYHAFILDTSSEESSTKSNKL